MFDLQFYAEIDWKCRKCREGNGRLQRTVISDKLTLILICVDWRESESGEWEPGHCPDLTTNTFTQTQNLEPSNCEFPPG